MCPDWCSPFLGMTAVCLVTWDGHVNQFVLPYVKPIIFQNFLLNNSSRLTCPKKKFSSPSWWSPSWWKMPTKCCKRKQTPAFRQPQHVSGCIHITDISYCCVLTRRTFSFQRDSWYKCQWVHYWTICFLLILLLSQPTVQKLFPEVFHLKKKSFPYSALVQWVHLFSQIVACTPAIVIWNHFP